MSVPYIICFVLLGIAGIANLVAMIFLILSVMNLYGSNMRKIYSPNFTLKLFICEPIINVHDDIVGLDNRKGGEENKTTDG